MNIVNDVTYKHNLFIYYEIICIMGYTQLTTSDNNVDLKIYVLISTLCHFYVSKFEISCRFVG
jgi:hypothetical protein